MGLTPFDLASYEEAAGEIVVTRFTAVSSESELAAVHADAIGHGTALSSLSTALPTSDLLPPVYFYGTASLKRDAPPTALAEGAFMYGVVRLTSDWPPQVRWTLVIRYYGADKWRMQGVQVGGVASQRGWCGVSTDRS